MIHSINEEKSNQNSERKKNYIHLNLSQDVAHRASWTASESFLSSAKVSSRENSGRGGSERRKENHISDRLSKIYNI